MELEERKKVDDGVNFLLNMNMDSESLSTADLGTELHHY
jgi:hypothetical protein